MKSIDQIITACEHCIGCKTSDSCYVCPYEPEDKCYDKLCDDVIFQLKRLKKLETPTEKEQPMLPGVEFFKREFKPDGKTLDYIYKMSPEEMLEYLRSKEELLPDEQKIYETLVWTEKYIKRHEQTEK